MSEAGDALGQERERAGEARIIGLHHVVELDQAPAPLVLPLERGKERHPQADAFERVDEPRATDLAIGLDGDETAVGAGRIRRAMADGERVDAAVAARAAATAEGQA